MSKLRKLQSGATTPKGRKVCVQRVLGPLSTSLLRSLPAEIDQTLKRVNEGVDDWDALWDKLEETEVRAPGPSPGGGRCGQRSALPGECWTAPRLSSGRCLRPCAGPQPAGQDCGRDEEGAEEAAAPAGAGRRSGLAGPLPGRAHFCLPSFAKPEAIAAPALR